MEIVFNLYFDALQRISTLVHPYRGAVAIPNFLAPIAHKDRKIKNRILMDLVIIGKWAEAVLMGLYGFFIYKEFIL